MPISYALVARGDIVLAHYASTSGNFMAITSLILKKVSVTDTQKSYEFEGYLFHYLVHDGITILCMTDEVFDRRIALAFLLDTKTRFFSRYSEDLYSRATSLQLNGDFSRLLANQMDYYSHNPSPDKINQMKGQLDTVKNLMSANVEKLQARFEKTDKLEYELKTTSDQAVRFNEHSKMVQSQIYKKNMKYLAFVVVLGVIILWLFISMFCGLSLRECT